MASGAGFRWGEQKDAQVSSQSPPSARPDRDPCPLLLIIKAPRLPWPLLLTGVFAPLPLKMSILGGATGPRPCRVGNEACLWGTGTSGL